ncbi:unnamed protein product [Notodromas monacha]|uniref:Uncharacterized protein n=1 Tax=Notodromas monacha TaxID=399045 RepID=A0A7R9GGH4_9CRUS|nr:unnamed protein product [Notodromas monacha]CAG0920198.1 unnamed protein product [Notodromas monacha]
MEPIPRPVPESVPFPLDSGPDDDAFKDASPFIPFYRTPNPAINVMLRGKNPEHQVVLSRVDYLVGGFEIHKNLWKRCAESMSSRDKWSAPCAVGLDSSAASSCGVGEGTAFAGGRLRYMPINYSSESGWWAGACQYSSITTPAPDMSRQQQQQQHHHHQGRHQEQQIGGGKSGTHRPVLAEHVADHAATLVAPDGSATPGLKQEFKACCRGLAKATSSKKNKGRKAHGHTEEVFVPDYLFPHAASQQVRLNSRSGRVRFRVISWRKPNTCDVSQETRKTTLGSLLTLTIGFHIFVS